MYPNWQSKTAPAFLQEQRGMDIFNGVLFQEALSYSLPQQGNDSAAVAIRTARRLAYGWRSPAPPIRYCNTLQ
jgi:hypothetical protein